MEYHKDQLSFADRMEYLRAPLAVQAAHQWLVRYCARRETSGVISDCGAWKDREWSVATNGQLRARDVTAVIGAGLASYNNADLVVAGYDTKGEQACVRERERVRNWKEQQNGTATQSRTGTATVTGTRTERVAESDQSRPVQTSPDQASPDQASRVGGEKTPTPPRAQLVKALQRRGMSTAESAVDEWGQFLQGSCGIKSLQEAPRALELLQAAAKPFGVTIMYSKQAAPYADQVAHQLASARAAKPGAA